MIFCGLASETFERRVINKLSDLFLIGGSAAKSFKYIGLNVVSTTCGVITVDQFQYASSLKPIPVSHQRATMKTSELSATEKKEFRALIGQLNWIATHTRLDTAFDVFELSGSYRSADIPDALRLNKVISRVTTDYRQDILSEDEANRGV